MIDPYTQKPIKAIYDNPEYTNLIAPVSRLEEIRRLLDMHDFKYQTDPFYISVQGAPQICFITFRRGSTDVATVQQVLDRVK